MIEVIGGCSYITWTVCDYKIWYGRKYERSSEHLPSPFDEWTDYPNQKLFCRLFWRWFDIIICSPLFILLFLSLKFVDYVQIKYSEYNHWLWNNADDGLCGFLGIWLLSCLLTSFVLPLGSILCFLLGLVLLPLCPLLIIYRLSLLWCKWSNKLTDVYSK